MTLLQTAMQRFLWILVLVMALGALPLASRAQQAPQGNGMGEMPGHDMPGHDMGDMGGMDGMDHMAMPGETGGRVKSPEELAADKRFSEFNHRMAGFFVLLVGLLGFLEPHITGRWKGFRYLWAVLFLVPGLYLMGWSDPEAWPFGDQTLMHVITQNLEVLQHKIFSVILLALGTVEFVRVRRDLTSLWVSSIFPVLAGAGALLLLFHVHGGHSQMTAEAHLTMQKIEKQHLAFATTGFGIALSKGIADVGRFQPRLMRTLFAVLMCVLGILLLTYTE
jgi:hypothetical protein